MPKRLVSEMVKYAQAFTPKSRSTENTLYNDAAIGDAVGIDTKIYDSVDVLINLGDVGATALAIAVGFADVDDAEDASFGLVTGATQAVVTADDGKQFVISLRAKDNKRYMFVKVTQTGAAAVVYSIGANLGDADKENVSQDQTVVVPADIS